MRYALLFEVLHDVKQVIAEAPEEFYGQPPDGLKLAGESIVLLGRGLFLAIPFACVLHQEAFMAVGKVQLALGAHDQFMPQAVEGLILLLDTVAVLAVATVFGD